MSRSNLLFSKLPFLIFMGVAAKLLVDTTVQIYGPFLVVFAGGAGIGTLAMGRIVAMRSLSGLVAPVLGSLADRIGHKTVMRASLFGLGITMIIAPITGSVVVFAVAIAISGAGQAGFTPNLQAYLSARLPYEKRALGLGIVEYSWGLAGVVGLFASGYLIEIYSWKAPFLVIGGLLVLMSMAFSLLPSEKRAISEAEKTAEKAPLPVRIRSFLDLGEHARSAWGAIAVTGLAMFACMHVILIHGGWLQAEYGLDPSGLGTVALILGICDLCASVSVSLFVDRIGKRRSVMIGFAGMSIGFLLLPFLNLNLGLAVLGIVLPRLFFEFAVVSNFSLLSEQAPEARGKVMSLSAAAGLLGTTLAGLTGPWAYLRFGVWGLGPVGLVLSVAGFAVLLTMVRERPHG